MMYPFIKKINNRILIRLNKDIYNKDLIDKAKKDEPASIFSITVQKNYYFLELNVDKFTEYFDFLNFLIYLKQNK